MVADRRDEEKTSVVEMEADGELRLEGSPLSGSFVNEQPSSEQMPGASEESLSGSLGKGTSASQKRVSRVSVFGYQLPFVQKSRFFAVRIFNDS